MIFFNKFEICTYFTVYVLFLIYGLYNIFKVRNKILELSTENGRFTEGWRIFNRPQDNTSDELQLFKDFISKYYLWYVIHIVGSEIFRLYSPKNRSILHSTVGCVFAITALKTISSLLLFGLIASYYLTSLRNSKSTVWTISAVWIIVINIVKNSSDVYNELGYQEYCLLIVTLSWSVLKGISFSLNKITNFKVSENLTKANQCYRMKHYLGYTLYFPTLVFGPFMIYNRYNALLEQNQNEENWSLLLRTKKLLVDVVRAYFWYIVLHILLHFCYVHYMEQSLSAVKLLPNMFVVYALGYFMGQYFFLYYIVVYGLGIAITRFEGLRPLSLPRCIGVIHYYTDMWKYFDQGLYEFLFLYIYAGICTKSSSTISKITATVATFTFIYVWHGYYMYIFIWSVLNLGCLALEKIFKLFVVTKWYKNKIVAHLSTRNQQRLYALLATQVFIPSAFSNMYFFAGQSVGNYFMYTTYCSGIFYYISFTICCYCFFQAAEIIALSKSKSLKNFAHVK